MYWNADSGKQPCSYGGQYYTGATYHDVTYDGLLMANCFLMLVLLYELLYLEVSKSPKVALPSYKLARKALVLYPIALIVCWVPHAFSQFVILDYENYYMTLTFDSLKILHGAATSCIFFSHSKESYLLWTDLLFNKLLVMVGLKPCIASRSSNGPDRVVAKKSSLRSDKNGNNNSSNNLEVGTNNNTNEDDGAGADFTDESLYEDGDPYDDYEDMDMGEWSDQTLEDRLARESSIVANPMTAMVINQMNRRKNSISNGQRRGSNNSSSNSSSSSGGGDSRSSGMNVIEMMRPSGMAGGNSILTSIRPNAARPGVTSPIKGGSAANSGLARPDNNSNNNSNSSTAPTIAGVDSGDGEESKDPSVDQPVPASNANNITISAGASASAGASTSTSAHEASSAPEDAATSSGVAKEES
jgi:uncharacterized membrane protein YgcG